MFDAGKQQKVLIDDQRNLEMALTILINLSQWDMAYFYGPSKVLIFVPIVCK